MLSSASGTYYDTDAVARPQRPPARAPTSIARWWWSAAASPGCGRRWSWPAAAARWWWWRPAGSARAPPARNAGLVSPRLCRGPGRHRRPGRRAPRPRAVAALGRGRGGGARADRRHRDAGGRPGAGPADRLPHRGRGRRRAAGRAAGALGLAGRAVAAPGGAGGARHRPLSRRGVAAGGLPSPPAQFRARAGRGGRGGRRPHLRAVAGGPGRSRRRAQADRDAVGAAAHRRRWWCAARPASAGCSRRWPSASCRWRAMSASPPRSASGWPQAIRYAGAVSDNRRGGDQFRIIGDRLLWGGGRAGRTRTPARLPGRIAADIAGGVPAAGRRRDHPRLERGDRAGRPRHAAGRPARAGAVDRLGVRRPRPGRQPPSPAS